MRYWKFIDNICYNVYLHGSGNILESVYVRVYTFFMIWWIHINAQLNAYPNSYQCIYLCIWNLIKI